VQRKVKKYNLDDFLEVANEEDVPDQTEDEPKGPTRSEIIRNDEDDELEPAVQDADADEDLDEDDYGIPFSCGTVNLQVRITLIMAREISTIMQRWETKMNDRS